MANGNISLLEVYSRCAKGFVYVCFDQHLLRPDQFTEPKVMLEFSREHQEKRFLKEIEDEIKQLSTDEVDLEVWLFRPTGMGF